MKTKILGNDVKTPFQFQFGFHKIFSFVPKIASKTYKSKPVLLLRSEEDLVLLVVPELVWDISRQEISPLKRRRLWMTPNVNDDLLFFWWSNKTVLHLYFQDFIWTLQKCNQWQNLILNQKEEVITMIETILNN